MNASGDYHTIDVPMYVTSLDTLETIAFDKENLLVHTATAQAYRYGTRYYYSLVDQYPENENLILGILYPCDIDKAINAADGTILSYDKIYVESQELTLITDLEGAIIRHMARWRVPAYRTSDNLYPAAEFAVMCLNLVPILLNLRLQRCKTDEAHSFHIRQYLASHFELEEHYDYLNMEQRLYLYRNLLRLSKNFGKNEQLYELIEKILTKRHIPIASYSVRHLGELDDEYRPDIRARRKRLNGAINISEMEYSPITALYEKERWLESGNDVELNDNSELMTLKLKNADSGVLQTKVLESNMVDYSHASPDKLNEVLLRELIHTVYMDRYKSYCTFRDPKDGVRYTLSSKDALVYIIYLAFSMRGIPITEVPEVMCAKHILDPSPTREEILAVSDKRYDLRGELADDLLEGIPKPVTIRSITAFWNRAHGLFRRTIRHWYILSNVEDPFDHGEAQKMINRIYGYTLVKLYDEPQNISEWLSRVNLPVYDRNTEDAASLITAVFSAVTGLSIDHSNSIPHIQRSLIKLMKKLTSYSIQYVAEINEDPIVLLNRVATRVGKPLGYGRSSHHLNPLVDVLDDSGHVYDRFDGSDQASINLEISQRMSVHDIPMDPILDTDIKLGHRTRITLLLNSPKVSAAISNTDPLMNSVPDNYPFLGYDVYKTLTQEQIKAIPN